MRDGAARDRHAFIGLDGLRGVAALMVFFYHGELSTVFPVKPEGAYLAVDIFFVMSGFVLAHAYEPRFRTGLGPWTFFKQRWVRLYPLYLAGLVLGAIYLCGDLWLHHNSLSWRDALAITPQFVLAPAGPTESMLLYPLNGAAWSLFAEILVNLLYALLYKRLNGMMFVVLMAIGAVGLSIAAVQAGSLDVGWGWGNAYGGLARACFGFFAGVLIYRLYAQGLRAPKAPAWLLAGLVAVLLCAPAPAGMRPYVDIAAALIASPILVLFAACTLAEGMQQKSALLLGRASYALYAIHYPGLALLGALAAKLAPGVLGASPLVTYVVVTIAFVWAALLLERVYDGPARRWLSQVLP